ncbi:murein hydrolase activator EnvC family protein [Wenjunlia vitaminophila]|uniref:murein hydrolase activator EnvC family protein n=1 Tax=Wenjunlia vitaminophila TaxID=76728 RepID=UPI0026BFF5ED|nr:M23 family metallopeptidase [Wenjunlia vitaminophila]
MLRGWEPPATPWGPGHRGVDLGAAAGDPVRSAAAGTVVFAGDVAGRGVVTVELAGSGRPALRTTYEPVLATVPEGARVAAGARVGTVQRAGTSHCAARCVHWGLRRGPRYLDPLSLLPAKLRRGGPSRLLPVFGVPPPGGTAGEPVRERRGWPAAVPLAAGALATRPRRRGPRAVTGGRRRSWPWPPRRR